MASAIANKSCQNLIEGPETLMVEPELCLNKEVDRLQTFASWPLSYIDPTELARWGFFYTNSRDIVRCHFCRVELGQWEETDVITCEHLKWSPHCRLMTKRTTDNEPIDPNFLDQLEDIVPDTTGNGGTFGEYSGSSGSIIRPEPEWNLQSVQNDSIPIYKPKHSQYRVESDRLASFKDWPKSMKQTAAQMADAGFFYTGRGDLVTCFACGGSLKDWLPGDEPFEEHAVNYPGCGYLRLVKSQEFIEKCLEKKKNKDCAMSEAPAGEEASRDEKEDEEQNDVPDAKLCKICYSRPFETVFIPCGHVVACGKCAASTSKCPMCNESYTNVQRIYLS